MNKLQVVQAALKSRRLKATNKQSNDPTADSTDLQGSKNQPQATVNTKRQQGSSSGRNGTQGSGRQVQSSYDDPSAEKAKGKIKATNKALSYFKKAK